MKKQARSLKVRMILLALVLAAALLAPFILAPHPAQAACTARGSEFDGALNMQHSAAMVSDTGPMSKNNPNGNLGMAKAVANSSCP